MCNIPCCLCTKYDECKKYLEDSRCRSCIHDNEDVLTSPCFKCQGFGNNPDYEDKYESI